MHNHQLDYIGHLANRLQDNKHNNKDNSNMLKYMGKRGNNKHIIKIKDITKIKVIINKGIHKDILNKVKHLIQIKQINNGQIKIVDIFM